MGRQDFSDRMKDSPWTLTTVPKHHLVNPGVVSGRTLTSERPMTEERDE